MDSHGLPFLGPKKRRQASTAGPGLEGLMCHFGKKSAYTKRRQKQTLGQKNISENAHFITYSVGKGGRMAKPLAPTLILELRLCFLPPKRLNSNLLGYESTRQKSEDHLVSGDRKESRTESTVTLSPRRDFSPRKCGCFLVSVVQGEPPHKR